jgi:hypothetical protein
MVNLSDDKIDVINDVRPTNIDPEAERKLLRKCDIRVLPPLFVLFLLAFLDRVNIGTSAKSYSVSHTNKYRQCENTRLAKQV